MLLAVQGSMFRNTNRRAAIARGLVALLALAALLGLSLVPALT